MIRPAMAHALTLAAPAILAGVFGAIAAAPAAAQAASPPKELRQACAADVRTLCSGIMPGGGRIKKCMVEKHDQLSDGCKSALKEARASSTNK